MINLLGWIGNIFLVWGIREIGNKRRFAHLLTMIGEAAWIGKSLMTGMYDLAFICAIFFLLAWRCWVKWGADNGVVAVCSLFDYHHRRLGVSQEG